MQRRGTPWLQETHFSLSYYLATLEKKNDSGEDKTQITW